MVRTTAQVSGMVCGMCEVHVNDAVRSAFRVKKVKSSRSRGETVIESVEPLDREKLRKVLAAAGYILLSAAEEKVERKTFPGTLWGRS